MLFIGPIKAHEYSVKVNPKPTLIADAILLGIVVTILVLINVLVIIYYGFNPLLILSWLLLGPIALWLLLSVIKCAKNIKKNKIKQNKKP